MFRELMRSTVSISHSDGTEDDDGAADPVTYSVSGCAVQVVNGTARSSNGTNNARSVTVLLPAEGFGDDWTASQGDTLTCDGVTYSVLDVTEVIHPRTLAVHHIETTCG